jgi:hypothetical protein
VGGAFGPCPPLKEIGVRLEGVTEQEIIRDNVSRNARDVGQDDAAVKHEELILDQVRVGARGEIQSSSIAAKPSLEAWVNELVSKKNRDLDLSGENEKAYHPEKKIAIPVYINGFKCDFCDEKFIHLTPCHMTEAEKKKGVEDYRSHLPKKHADVYNNLDDDYASPDRRTNMKLVSEIEDLKKLGDSQAKQIQELIEMNTKLMTKVEEK